MNNNIKYDHFEKIIQTKLDDYVNEYGKSWKSIDNKLNNSAKSNKKRNVIILSLISVFGILFYGYYEFPQKDSLIIVENKKDIASSYKAEEKSKKEIFISEKVPTKTNNEKVIIYNKKNSKTISSLNEKDTIEKYLTKETPSDTIILLKEINEPINENSFLEKELKILTNKNSGCIRDTFYFSYKNEDLNKFDLQWYINNMFVSNLSEFYYIPNQSGEYKIELQTKKKDLKNYKISDSISISIFESPSIDFKYEITENNGIVSTYFSPYLIEQINDFSSKNLKLKKGDFNWDFGDGSVSNMALSRNQFSKNGTYKVSLDYTSLEGCHQKIEKSIEITSNFDILAPNSFTPNGDGKNDDFMPEGLKTKGQPFEMKIFNKTGNIIFITNNINNRWNGFNQATGSRCKSDNYLWIVEIKEESGKTSLYKGTILLIDN